MEVTLKPDSKMATYLRSIIALRLHARVTRLSPALHVRVRFWLCKTTYRFSLKIEQQLMDLRSYFSQCFHKTHAIYIDETASSSKSLCM